MESVPPQRRRIAVRLAIAMWASSVAGEAAAQDQPAGGQQTRTARIAWQYTAAGSRFEGVLYRGGTVFALDRSGAIHAIDAATGDKRWQSAGKLPFDYGYGIAFTPQQHADALVVGCDTGLFALDRTTGKQLWHTAIDTGVAGPACTDTLAIAGGADGKVHACDLKSGRIVWQHEYLEDRPDDPPGFDGEEARFPGRPARPGRAATDGKMVALSIFDQCRAIALDATTGKRLWDLRTQGWMFGEPAFGSLNVFAGSQDRGFYAVDKETGKLAWKLTTGARVEAGATPAERFVYFGSCDGHLYAVDQTVDRIAWKFATQMTERGGAPIYGRPLVRGGTVYLAAMKGTIYAVDRKSGALQWQLEPLPKSELTSDLVGDGNRIFVTACRTHEGGKGAVLAIELP